MAPPRARLRGRASDHPWWTDASRPRRAAQNGAFRRLGCRGAPPPAPPRAAGAAAPRTRPPPDRLPVRSAESRLKRLLPRTGLRRFVCRDGGVTASAAARHWGGFLAPL